MSQVLEGDDWGDCGKEPDRVDEIPLRGGQGLAVIRGLDADTMQLSAADGRLLVQIRVTDEGPSLVLEGASLELRATRDLRLKAERIDIDAALGANLTSNGPLNVQSDGEMNFTSPEDIRMVAKIIHLN